MKAKATYSVKKWEENTYKEIPPQMKMTKASVEFALTGEMEGTASVEYLMMYTNADPQDQHKATAAYMGLFRFEGTVQGKRGGVVLKDEGKFENGAAVSALRIVDGSGTENLAGISGTGWYRADQNGCALELDYKLP